MEESKIKSTKNGEEIQKYLDNVNMEPWFFIYENYIKKDQKPKSMTASNLKDTLPDD